MGTIEYTKNQSLHSGVSNQSKCIQVQKAPILLMGVRDPGGETRERDPHWLFHRFTYLNIFINKEDGHHDQTP